MSSFFLAIIFTPYNQGWREVAPPAPTPSMEPLSTFPMSGTGWLHGPSHIWAPGHHGPYSGLSPDLAKYLPK